MTQTGAYQRSVVAFCHAHLPRLLALTWLLMVMSSPTRADVLTVDADGGQYADLQSAIDAAEDGDTIEVHPGTYTGTGNAVATVPSINSRLEAGDVLTIISVGGPEVTIIDGGNERQGIKWSGVNGGLNGFTIRNCLYTCTSCGIGDPSDLSGAGMLATDACLAIEDCVFTKNVAMEAGGGLAIIGSGTCSSDDRTIVRNCTFSMNTLEKNGSLDLSDDGAGMHVLESDILLENVMFTENNLDESGEPVREDVNGVGLHASFSDIEIRDCLFDANRGVVEDDSKGGGAALISCNATLETCTFTSNGALDGGGLYISEGSTLIRECVLGGTPGTNKGNACWNLGSGGGLDAETSVNVATDLQIESTYIGGNEAHIGGGMYLISESDTNGDNHAVGRFDRCVFQGNSATYGGGAALNGVGGITSAALNFRGCSFIGNESKGNGGGVSVGGPNEGSSSFEGVRPTFSYCLFTCNHAGVDPPGDSNSDPLYHAGAVLVTEAVDSVTFANCLVHDNSTTQGSGGGIVMDLQFQYDTTICNTSFQSNRATYQSTEFETSCLNCEIGGNVPGRGCGGGLYVDNAWCDDPQADAEARYVCLSFANNEASHACTSQVRVPGCSEPTDECPWQCNTNIEGPCDGCNDIGVGLNIPSVEGLTCDINPLKRLFCPLDTCTSDLDGDGTVDGADLTILLGNWADDAVSCEEDAYPLTNGNPDSERMDIESAPLHGNACSGPPAPCLPLWIDPAWLNQLECSNTSPDINCDGTVDGADLSIMLGNWGPCE